MHVDHKTILTIINAQASKIKGEYIDATTEGNTNLAIGSAEALFS